PRCTGTPQGALLAGVVASVAASLSSVTPKPSTAASTPIATQLTTRPAIVTSPIFRQPQTHPSQASTVTTTILAPKFVAIPRFTSQIPSPPTATSSTKHPDQQQQQTHPVPKLASGPRLPTAQIASTGRTPISLGPPTLEPTRPTAAAITSTTSVTHAQEATVTPTASPRVVTCWPKAAAGIGSDQKRVNNIPVQQQQQLHTTQQSPPLTQTFLRTPRIEQQHQSAGTQQQLNVTTGVGGGANSAGSFASHPKAAVVTVATAIPATLGVTPPTQPLFTTTTTSTSISIPNTLVKSDSAPQPQPSPQPLPHASPTAASVLLSPSTPPTVAGAVAAPSTVGVTAASGSVVPSSYSSISPKQNVLLKQLLQNCPSAESGVSPNANAALTGNGSSPVLVVKEQPALITSQLVNNNNSNHTVINNNSNNNGRNSNTNNSNSSSSCATVPTPPSAPTSTTPHASTPFTSTIINSHTPQQAAAKPTASPPPTSSTPPTTTTTTAVATPPLAAVAVSPPVTIATIATTTIETAALTAPVATTASEATTITTLTATLTTTATMPSFSEVPTVSTPSSKPDVRLPQPANAVTPQLPPITAEGVGSLNPEQKTLGGSSPHHHGMASPPPVAATGMQLAVPPVTMQGSPQMMTVPQQTQQPQPLPNR
ncbi:hypothetical protein BIW11_12468, partial [Tropilaelaps mercedesae]